jgi:predicted XRE-type DNA-binding protein
MPNGRSKKSDLNALPRTEASSGNVFADLGLPHPDLALAKAELVQRIRGLIAEKELTQVQAAEMLGLDQPKISALVRGRVSGFSIDRLFRLLNALGQRVEINVRPVSKRAHSASERTILVTS